MNKTLFICDGRDCNAREELNANRISAPPLWMQMEVNTPKGPRNGRDRSAYVRTELIFCEVCSVKLSATLQTLIDPAIFDSGEHVENRLDG